MEQTLVVQDLILGQNGLQGPILGQNGLRETEYQSQGAAAHDLWSQIRLPHQLEDAADETYHDA